MAKDKKKFKVIESTEEDIKQQQEEATNGGGIIDPYIKPGIQIYKPKKGQNRLRIGPIVAPTDDKIPTPKHFGFRLSIHKNEYNSLPRYEYLDLTFHKGKPDPITEEFQKAAKTLGFKHETTKALRAKDRIAYYVLDRDEEAKGWQLWVAQSPKYGPATNFDAEIIALTQDDEKNYVNFVSPEKGEYKGHDIVFEMEKAENGPPSFKGLKLSSKSKPLHDDPKKVEELLEWIADHPISECFNFYDYKRIASVFGGAVDADSEADAGSDDASSDDSTDEKPKKDKKADKKPAKDKPEPSADESADSDDSDAGSDDSDAGSDDKASADSDDSDAGSDDAAGSDDSDAGSDDSDAGSDDSDAGSADAASDDSSSEDDKASADSGDADSDDSDSASADTADEKPAKADKKPAAKKDEPAPAKRGRGRPKGSGKK